MSSEIRRLHVKAQMKAAIGPLQIKTDYCDGSRLQSKRVGRGEGGVGGGGFGGLNKRGREEKLSPMGPSLESATSINSLQ